MDEGWLDRTSHRSGEATEGTPCIRPPPVAAPPSAAVAQMIQGGGSGVRGPAVTTPGGTLEVEVAPNEDEVTIHPVAGQGSATKHPVEPGRTATIPVPMVPPGTVLIVEVGKGSRSRFYPVLVVESA